VLYRWWLVQPLVYRCLLGMVDNKSQRRHLTTQHTTRAVATPRPLTTAPRLQNIISQLMLPSATTPNPRSIILPRATLSKGRVIHRRSEVLHHHISWVNILLRWILLCHLPNIQIIYCLVVWEERKGEIIQQPSEHLRYSNSNCRALFVISLRRITSFN
jgi:hypothetical protein